MTRTRRAVRGSNKTMRSHYKCCKATMHGLNEWYEKMFEELGWMVLAKSRGMNDKIHTYMNSLKRLKMALEYKKKHVADSDRKNDIDIMYDNLEILIAHVHNDFGRK